MFTVSAALTQYRFAISRLAGPLGNPTGPSSSSAAGSRGNSHAGSRENLCEECIQNPLDLIDASIQVRTQNQNAPLPSPPLTRLDKIDEERTGPISRRINSVAANLNVDRCGMEITGGRKGAESVLMQVIYIQSWPSCVDQRLLVRVNSA